MSKIIDELFSKGAHYGYTKTKRHPSVKEYIFGTKDNIDLIDLEKTEKLLENAKKELSDITSKGGKIIFVGNKNEIIESAESCPVEVIKYKEE